MLIRGALVEIIEVAPVDPVYVEQPGCASKDE